ncbi:lactococcin 972 family bacteriocin [Shouchella patagoniensis]|uniref:lactococcin 972 family bacteriocin n=1 Tax=Shouchella patagoniensis TaxID=228576 RepID=UPI0009958D74|nr:lactococcin 972 family bacteriocin [Shouchella patagoniensis]
MTLSLSTNAFAAEETSGGGIVGEDYVSIFKQVGGGTWDQGTKTKGIFNKTKEVWSNYWHPSKVHGSAAQLGAKTPNRSCVKKDLTSKAFQSSSNTDLTAYTYWNTSCKL